ncbi:ABC transporter permease [Bacillus salacetis]|uniref:ABC transporter permease n=1 Tax=Bacillus salacetis TaxID=2315464 RepID=A0A3A1R0B5_9BACI|nr:ABC transporter permease subunit [Bacillus salacetis]RIW35120.1 ABC transporter permease [Bacillus salacetis]
MRQFIVLLKKELLESRRNLKWVWMPVVFILFGITEPLTAYYMPDILDAVGNLPEGAVIEIPTPTSEEVLLSTLGQYSMLGVLVIVLGFMGTVAGERKNGSAFLVLAKPVSSRNYILSKWTAAMIIVWVSYISGMLISWYYINILFEAIAAEYFMQTLIAYGLWLSFVLSLTVFFSSLTSSQGLSAFSAIAASILLSFLSGTFSRQLEWLPSQLSSYAEEIMLEGNWSFDLSMTMIITMGSIILLMAASSKIFKNSELS